MTEGAGSVRCDLVIPVYNALRSTRACLESVRRFAPPWARVVVINDASDAATTEWLRAQTGIVLLENAENLGFVRTANRGLLYSDAPWVCLLNSDTLLTEGALERMVARCERDPTIGLCCPLSNGAVNLSVKLPPGEDVFSFARRVARTSPALYPDAVTIVGFCLLVKREVLLSLGVFDEIFGRGYCEETDLHYRARAAGWRCVVADDTWIHHRNGGSFTDGGARTERNMEILMSRWREFHEREIRDFDRRNDLGAVRDVSTYEWTRPDDRPPESHDLLVLVSGRSLSPEAASQLELANECVLAGLRAGAVALDGAEPEKEMELWFRPYCLSSAELLASPPPTRAWIAASPEARRLLATLPVRPARVDPAALFSRRGPEPVGSQAGIALAFEGLRRRVRDLFPFDHKLAPSVSSSTPARSQGRHRSITHPLLFLVLAIYCLKLCLYNPLLNWDIVGYIGSANALALGDTASLRVLTYTQLRHSVPSPIYDELTNGSFRREISLDSSAFREQLPFYQIRLVYTGLIYLLFKLGCDIVLATYTISGASVVAGVALLYVVSKRILARPFLYAIPPLAVIFGVPDLARYSTPDGLAFLSAILCAYLYLARRFGLLLIVLPITVAVRTDLILFSIPLLFFIVLSETGWRFRAAFSACASVGVYVGIGAHFRNPGWSTIFYHSFVGVMTHPASTPVPLNAPHYFRALMNGAAGAISDKEFTLYVLVAMYSFYLIKREAGRTSIFSALKSPTMSLPVVCFVSVASHFVAFPVVWDRFFAAQYMISVLSLLAMVSDGMGTPRALLRPSGEDDGRFAVVSPRNRPQGALIAPH
jgi:GT2 family glycosyltransferase